MLNKLPQVLKEKWEASGFNSPTSIQSKTFDLMLNNEELVAISPTGSGKTLAYLLPLLTRLKANGELQALIFAPSQELAQQIGRVAEEWSQALGLTAQTLIGGANIRRQIERLKDKPELIIATPGRFLELLNQSAKLKVHLVETVVFDEADYLLLAGGEQAELIEAIQKRLMRDVRYSWFSATQSADLQTKIDKESSTARTSQWVIVGDEKVPEQIQHFLIETSNREKASQLRRIAQFDRMQAIVFFEQVNELETVAAKLLYDKVPVVTLHSQLSNTERQLALQIFSQGQATYLLTTDVAARGIDLADVPYIIHYNRVEEPKVYLHRSGRTGRMGKEGHVLSLVNQQEARDLIDLLQALDLQPEWRHIYDRQLVSDIPKANYKEGNRSGNISPALAKRSEDKNSSNRVRKNPKKKAESSPSQAKKRTSKKRHKKQKNKGKKRG